jgi:hypothetical protein
MFQGGCSGCNEEYFCDETGCYWCDSYGCRPVDVPERAECSHGDWECPPDRPFCTADGYCVAQCETDPDCPAGLRCVEGLCVEPDVVVPPPLHHGFCGGTDVCATTEPCPPTGCEYCAESGCCLPVDAGACCADIDCEAMPGMICDVAEHVCVTAPEDAGTDDGTTDGGTDEGPPPPPPQCHNNGECHADYLCIDGVCKLPCTTSAECGVGCNCVGGFCTSPEA